MPFVISKKFRIYYELRGENGPWLILHAPFLISLDAWHFSDYVKILEEHFRLLLIDPLGQGKSDKPENLSNYFFDKHVQNVIDVMQEINIDYAHFFGIGLGAQIGFQLSINFPSKIKSLITAGAHPFSQLDKLKNIDDDINQLKLNNINFILEKYKKFESLSDEQLDKILNGNGKSYSCSLEAAYRWKGIADELDILKISVLLFTYKEELNFLSVRDAGKKIRYGKYVILPKIEFKNGLWDKKFIIDPLLDFIKRNRN